MTQWQYITIWSHTPTGTKSLNEHGAQGWEVYSVHCSSNGATYYFLKKRIED